MTTSKKVKLKKSDDHTNIDKYRVAANITECYMISKLKQNSKIHDVKAIISLQICMKNERKEYFLTVFGIIMRV